MAFLSPVYRVRAVPIEKIEPNTYNPNSVAPPELQLLYDSIREDGYTMPIVCYHDQGRDIYIIIDGFHRYRVMLDYPDIYQQGRGQAPLSPWWTSPWTAGWPAPSATTAPAAPTTWT